MELNQGKFVLVYDHFSSHSIFWLQSKSCVLAWVGIHIYGLQLITEELGNQNLVNNGFPIKGVSTLDIDLKA